MLQVTSMRKTLLSWAEVTSFCTSLEFMAKGFSMSTFFLDFIKSLPVLRWYGWMVPMYTTSREGIRQVFSI